MLLNLKIENFALIPKLELQFENGFSVLTGETGSGKSILLGALNLILGDRADLSVIRDIDRKTIVEGVFAIKAYDLEMFFEENDLDYLPEVVIRREISNQGKSRAFVNDTPVQLSVLKILSEKLIHIHSQHHTLELKSVDFQFDILDYLTDSLELRTQFRSVLLKLKKLQKRKTEKTNEFRQILQNEDYVKFQLQELEKLNLEKVSFEKLEEELTQIEHFDSIQETFQQLDMNLNGENAALSQLHTLKGKLERNKHLHPFFETVLDRIQSVSIELKDIVTEALNFRENVEFQPERKLEIEKELSYFNSVLLKHGVRNQEELLEVFRKFTDQTHFSEDLKVEIEELTQEIITQEALLHQLGEELHQNRFKRKTAIEQQIQSILAELKMEKSKIEFALEKTTQANEFGLTALSLNFSPNVGLGLKPIEKIASGGELSRLMLVFQLLLSEKKELPSMIFDEIDTGVSGEVAQKLGNLFQKMGEKMQVLAITHLPQVAAKGKTHIKVSKSQSSETTISEVYQLSTDEKVIEIARLMSGEEINEAAIMNAKALMN